MEVQNLTKSFGSLVLFENISFSIAERQRVGLIAKNGTGKSTLLSLLSGKDGYDTGDIIYKRDLKVGFLEQSPVFDPDDSVLDACFNHQGDDEKVLKAKQILTQLKIRDLHQPMRQLSGGQQKRVALANVLIGNYSYYLEKRQERIDNRRAEIARANNLYRTELDWMRRQPQARGHKAKYREDAFYDLERLAKSRIEERAIRLKASNVYIGSKIFECQYISKAFDDTIIMKDFYYNFSRFEKMGIVGNNGTGKSTFLKMLLGQQQPDEGRIVIGETVRFGYFSQEGLKFDEQQKVIDVVRDIAEEVDLGSGRRLSASQFLQHFLFTPEQQHNYVYKLSGGEKRKLYLCTVLMRNPNFLVLDEPTNDLDIVTLQILEEYLQDFPGCVIVVSHDRYFMDKVVDHLLVFKGQGEIKDFPGNYTQYREWQALQPKESASAAQKPAKVTTDTRSERETKRKMSFKEKREFEQLEKDIATLEDEKKQIEDALSSGTLSVDEITQMSKRLPLLNDELDEKSMRWLELSELA